MWKPLLFLVSLLFSGTVLANEASALAGVINQVFDVTTGLASTSPYVDDGKRLFSLCLLIAISWAGIKTLVDDSGFMGGISHLIKTAIIAGLAAFFMQASTLHSLVKGFDYLGQKAVAATGNSMQISLENPAKAMVNVAGHGMKQVFILWNGPDTEENQSKRGLLQNLASSILAGDILNYATEQLAKVGLSIISLVSLVLFLLSYFTSQMMVNIGLIFAPLFIPWLILESTSFLFHGWLKFVIVAGVQKMVGALLFALGLKLMDSLPAITAMASSHSEFVIFPYTAAILLTLFMLTLQWQGASIAAGLVSGMPSTSMMWPRIPKPSPKNPKQNGNNGAPSPGAPPGPPPQRQPTDPNRFNPGRGK